MTVRVEILANTTRFALALSRWLLTERACASLDRIQHVRLVLWPGAAKKSDLPFFRAWTGWNLEYNADAVK